MPTTLYSTHTVGSSTAAGRTRYNNDHKHSGIRYVSPAHRHAGEDRDILAARHALYVQAKAAHPRRWARHTRNWNPITVVTLNPERDSVIAAAQNAAEETRTAA